MTFPKPPGVWFTLLALGLLKWRSLRSAVKGIIIGPTLLTVKHQEDWDTDDQMTKAIMLADGKVIDKNSLVTVTKKSA